MKMPPGTLLLRALGALLLLTLIFPSGVQGIGGADSDSRPVQPAAASLEYFEATAQNGHVGLEWQTVSELQTAGFNLKRAIVSDPAQATQINPALIPGHPGSQSGYYYIFEDRSGLAPGVTYYYWLEHVDLSGLKALYLDYMVSATYTGPPLPSSPVVQATIVDGGVRLGWMHLPENTSYQVWRSTTPYFTPGAPGLSPLAVIPAPTLFMYVAYTDAGSIGDVAVNYVYAVRGANARGVSTVTQWSGEFDFALVPGQ
ncbi:MAG: hypothetical protein NT169_24400 [Chloroflexi bacterium]|nr:hypothetical protein [Chloroflexota bacterium]